MTWLLIVGLAWVALAAGIAVPLGRSIRMADVAAGPGGWTDDVERYVRDRRTTSPR